jgi:hypothetical protein
MPPRWSLAREEDSVVLGRDPSGPHGQRRGHGQDPISGVHERHPFVVVVGRLRAARGSAAFGDGGAVGLLDDVDTDTRNVVLTLARI